MNLTSIYAILIILDHEDTLAVTHGDKPDTV